MKVSKESRSSWLFLIKHILPQSANETATAYHWQKRTIRTVLKHALSSLMVCEYMGTIDLVHLKGVHIIFTLLCCFFFIFLLSCHPFKVILLHTCISSRMHAVTYLNNTSFFSIVSLLCGVASEDYPRCLCARVCVFFFFFFCCCFLGISK